MMSVVYGVLLPLAFHPFFSMPAVLSLWAGFLAIVPCPPFTLSLCPHIHWSEAKSRVCALPTGICW